MTHPFTVHVVADYQAPYPDPIRAEAGEEVIIDLEKKTEIQGWVWCTDSSGRSGWVPAQYLEIKETRGKVLHDYDAIELTIHAGEMLTVYKEESHFYWVANQSGQRGWVPVEHVERAAQNQDKAGNV